MKISHLGLAILLIVLSGCAAQTNTKKDTINTSVLSPTLMSNNSDLVNTSDSHALKEKEMLEILECNKNPDKREQEKCYDEFIKEKINFKTSKQLLQEMDESGDKDNNFRLTCHSIAHSIGRNTYYKSNSSIPNAFQQCAQTCHAGCYHGVLQAFFLGEGYTGTDDEAHLSITEMKEKVKFACNEFGSDVKQNFQCLHGMGHAIQFFVSNNLTKSLDICDALQTSYEKESCYGGTFMENVVSVNKDTRWIKPAEPLYPCSALDEKYKYQCYLMQTSVMIELFGEDADKLIDGCKNADKGYVETCFTSFGRDRSNYVRIKSELPYQDLKKIDKKYQMDYINGLVYALVDNTWDGYYAFPFCSKLDNEELKDGCYKTAANYLNVNLGSPKEDVKKSCELHAPKEDKEYCLERV